MLLRSKITKPAYPVTVVPRARLFVRLQPWQDARAVVVHAPSGYGKSTLISHWVDVAGLAASTAWLSLDEYDADDHQFVEHLAAALDRVVPGAADAVRPILDDTRGDAARALRRLLVFFDETTQPAGNHLLLVLDDLHRAQSPQTYALLATVIEHGPETLHLVLLARGRPNLPLARLYARGELIVLTIEELRFTAAEVRDYLLVHGFAAPGETDMLRLVQRSEGWAAALQLSVLSSPRRDSIAVLNTALQGDSTWLVQYLVEEVLDLQPPDVRSFLLQTSLLNAFNAQLSAAVTGVDDAAAMLVRIARADLFLIPLDRDQAWFRYHHLFQAILRQHLEAQTDASLRSALHRRAATWLADAGSAPEAVAHYLAAGEDDAAASLVEAQIRDVLLRDPYAAQHLLNLLPRTQLRQRPRLLLNRCRLAILVDDPAIGHHVQQAAVALAALPPTAADYRTLNAELLVFRVAEAFARRDHACAIEAADRAMAQAHLLDDFMAGSLHFLRMHLAINRGLDAEAAVEAEQVLTVYSRAGFHAGTAAIQRELAKWVMRRGRAQEASARFRRLFAEQVQSVPMVDRELAVACVPAAENCYWQGDLAEARAYQQKLLSLARTLQDDQLLCMAEFMGLVYADDRGHDAAAWQALSALDPVFAPHPLRINAIEMAMRSLVAMGDDDRAWLLAAELGLVAEEGLAKRADRFVNAYCLAYLARGADLAAITPLLADALAYRQTIDNRLGQVQVLTLLAWQQVRLGKLTAARQHLAHAVPLARETGYVRIVWDIPQLAMLLRQVEASLALKANGKTAGAAAIALTDQESAVLTLLDADLTYQQIAAELVVSVNTVREHIRNLYRKLGVHRRSQAVEMAWTRGLLPATPGDGE